MNSKKTKIIMNIVTVLSICLMIAFTIYGIKTGLFKDRNQMAALVGQAGIWAPIIFILVQIVQVVIPIIPGGITCAVGVVLFGPWQGLLYNYVGIVVGSLINFYLARQYGVNLVKFFVNEKTYEKYAVWLEEGKRFDKFFALAIFFPFAPDDVLCLIAGLTKMSWKKFSTIILLGKPASIALYSLALVHAGSWIGTLIA